MNKWQERIEFNPKIMGGKPVIKGTRVPVQVIVGSLAGGLTPDDVCKDYNITKMDVEAALSYATEVLAEEKIRAVSG